MWSTDPQPRTHIVATKFQSKIGNKILQQSPSKVSHERQTHIRKQNLISFQKKVKEQGKTFL